MSLIILVSGCDSRYQAQNLLDDYVADLNRSQLIRLDSPAILMPISLPTARDRANSLSTFDVSLLEFLSLQQCDVGIVAGRKNSILGRVMADSQRFLYEIDIIRAIESCSIKDKELAQTLEQVAQQKRVELPKAFGNGIFNGAESEAFFSLSNGFLPLTYRTADQQDLINALTQLVQLGKQMQTLPKLDSEQFEQNLKVMMDSEYAGRLLFSLVQIRVYLTAVGQQIQALTADDCGAPMAYLKQQFERHYVKQIQPYMGRISQTAYQVLPLLNQLAELSFLSPKMMVFLTQFDMSAEQSEWRRYQLASQQHARAWSQWFTLCGVGIAPSN